jgi:hypothetical protein
MLPVRLNTTQEDDMDEHSSFETPLEEVSIEQVAIEVIAGSWGEGRECRSLLSESGFDPDVVERMVARLRRQNGDAHDTS